MYTREHQDYFALQVLSQGLIEGEAKGWSGMHNVLTEEWSV